MSLVAITGKQNFYALNVKKGVYFWPSKACLLNDNKRT